ncbi:Failed axon connections, partial [Armadillidium vulgare]
MATGIFSRAAARLEWDSAGQDVVVLHGFPRSKVCPNLSPYVLKLETYLRVAGIKYK